jgi:hypothetical protein
MTAKHIKKLELLKEKRQAIQDEEERISKDIAFELSQNLIDCGALYIDFDVFIGGMLEVIEKAKKESPQKEVWKTAGQKFRQQRSKRKTSRVSSKTKKVA